MAKRKLAKLWSFFGGWEKPSMNPVGNGGRRLLGTVPGGWQSWQFVYHRGEFIIRIFRVFGDLGYALFLLSSTLLPT